MEKPRVEASLKRELGLFETTAYGIGIILGAGIYVLIGKAAGVAGNSVWLSFMIAAVLASFTGLSYAELSSLFQKDSAEYTYTKKAFRNPLLSFMIGYLIVVTGVVGTATVALGFSGYFSALFHTPIIMIAILAIILFSILNFYGIKQSAEINVIFTFIEAGGLVLIILLGLNHIGEVDYFEMPAGFSGVLTASALIFFAYIGFEDIVKLGEEVKDPQKTLPKALILSIIITTVIYILLSVSVISIMPADELGKSDAPLADVAAKAMGSKAFLILSVVALFSTSNTVLILLISTSRMLYGLSCERCLPKYLMKVHPKTATPWLSIITVMAAAVAFSMAGSIEYVANVTNLGTFLVFTLVNLSLIKLRYSMPDAERGFKVPFNIGRFPLTAGVGIVFTLFMVGQFTADILISGAGIIGFGLLLYGVLGQVRKSG
ncbi:MAG: APC family permease [Candidatus Altiarchaeota archaeon]